MTARLRQAARQIAATRWACPEALAREAGVSHQEATALLEELHQAGIVGPPRGSLCREVLVHPDRVDALLESR